MQQISLTATQQLQALASGKTTAVELLEQAISRAEEIAPILNPIALKLYGRARQAAQEADKKRASGKFGRL
jgi:Asp-tRNA(Asn)/Glu-tRNA(Gln) amidotransferase A subunit family amidase